LTDGNRVRVFKSSGETIDGLKGQHNMARLQQQFYREKVVPDLMRQFGYKSVMQVPRIDQDHAEHGRERGGGRQEGDGARRGRPAPRSPARSRWSPSRAKAIAGFKIRDGYPIGCMVTLRGARMYEFLDRLVTVALPRVRDFRGVSGRAFDGRGNYNIGVKEQIIFPEIEYDKVDALRGMNISITTTAKTDDECKALLAAFRFPFKN
jgi:large subunit ribosomal protein L5